MAILTPTNGTTVQAVRVLEGCFAARVRAGELRAVFTRPPKEIRTTLEPEPLIAGLPLRFVNPYDITPDSSIDFVAWQLSRAVRAAYGVEVDPEGLRQTHLSVLRGRVTGPFFSHRFLEAHPEIDRVTRRGVVGGSLALLVLGWILAGWRATRPNVPCGDRPAWRKARARTVSSDAILGALFLAATFGPFLWSRRLPGIQDALAAASVDALGGSEWALPAIVLVLAVMGYAWLARRFERLEVPPALRRAWYQAPE